LPDLKKRLIKCKFGGNFWSLLGFNNIITFAYFQGFGNWDSQRQWLNECIWCTGALLGRWLRHLFRISSSPQALLNFDEFANHVLHKVGCRLQMWAELGL
jgi:hypothetical protein